MRSVRVRAVLATVLVAVVLGALWRTRSFAPPAAPAVGAPVGAADSADAAVGAEFLAIADSVQNGPNPMVGLGPIVNLRVQSAATSPSTSEGRSVRAALATELLRLGKIDDAIDLLDESIAAYESLPARAAIEPDLYLTRALAHLRAAEVANCVSRHNRDCCILPLQGGGLHAISEPARLARQDYLTYLGQTSKRVHRSDPTTIMNRRAGMWLLNIACMALDDYPNGVPAEYRVAPFAFASDADIGRFVDVAPQLGLDPFDHAGGAIVDDFDGDGLYDVVTSTCDLRGPMKAFRNRGDGTFEDVAAAWRLDHQLGGLHIAGADYDNDGDLDIVVPRGAWMFEDGRIRKSLLRNDGAAGFTDVTRAAGLAEPASPTQAVVWADFDGDGRLDLFVGNESRVELIADGPSHPSQLFRNNGDGTFTDVAAAAGVRNDRYAKGAAGGDYDNDGDMDLYISNVGPNRLYRNDGGMRFTDVAPELGVTEPDGRSFATWFFDLENDGDLDIWVNAYDASVVDVALSAMGEPHAASAPCLYRNDGGRFTDIAREVGVDQAWLPMGASFGDFDNDGWQDVYLGTGDPSYQSIMPNIALRNDGGRRFQDITLASGLGHLQKGHEVCFADLDDDGDQDIYHQLGGLFPGDAFRNALFLNPGHANRYVKIELVGVTTNRQGVGARIDVQVETPRGPRTIHRAAGCVSSFGQCPRRQEIGLGDATRINGVEISWPTSGLRQELGPLPLDSSVRVTEGVAEVEALERHPLTLAGTPPASANLP
jgi:hypothetical protein